MARGGIALAAVITVSSAGCGGEMLSRAEYVAGLDAACRDFAAREEKIGEPQSMTDLVEKGPRVLEAFEQTIVETARELEALEEIAGKAGRMVELADRQRDVLAGLIEAANEGDFAKVRRVASENAALNEEAGAIARELGADACAGR